MPVNKPSEWKLESRKWKVSKSFSIFLLTGIFCLAFFTASAQGGDSTNKAKIHPVHSPKKAMLYAAICPGLGQLYNQKYWKLPILYAGLGTAVYFIFFNQHYYNLYNNQLSSYNPNSLYNIYSTSELSQLITYYHNDRDLSIIIAVGVYLISIVDANVDAQLHGFNVSDDISFRFTPNFVPTVGGTMAFTPGFTLVKKFGK
jgi:hypothetical protein